MTLTRFRQVLALAEAGSFRRAARVLKVSQPVLTKAVQALEKELGVRLFDRQPGGVTLTEFGRRVIAHARTLADAEGDLRHDLSLIAGLETGRVDVALGPYPSVISGYAAAARLTREHPNLAVGLRVANWRAITKAVLDRQVDLGIAELAGVRENEDLATELIGTHKARFFCRPGHAILRRRRITLADMMQFPWVTTRLPPRIAAGLPGALARAGTIDPATGDLVPAVELDVPMRLADFARESDALALGVFSLVEHELRSGSLAVVANAPCDMWAQYGFIWPRQRSLSAATLAYMQAVRDEERLFLEREMRLAKRFEHGRRADDAGPARHAPRARERPADAG